MPPPEDTPGVALVRERLERINAAIRELLPTDTFGVSLDERVARLERHAWAVQDLLEETMWEAVEGWQLLDPDEVGEWFDGVEQRLAKARADRSTS
jgi:hypothetical protein